MAENFSGKDVQSYYDTAAARCVLDHDPETASWSESLKLATIAYGYCDKEANGNGIILSMCFDLMMKGKEQIDKTGGLDAIIASKKLFAK